jgi:hypothetical protein
MAQTFCEKIPLHRQVPDLLVQRRQLRLIRRRTAVRPSGTPREQRGDPFQQGLLPGVDLARMHPEPARQLRYRAVLADRRQRHLRLEVSPALLASIHHLSPLA